MNTVFVFEVPKPAADRGNSLIFTHWKHLNVNIHFDCLAIKVFAVAKYSKNCVKQPLQNRQNKDLDAKW